jgi:3-dehydroquinate dehydratase type I
VTPNICVSIKPKNTQEACDLIGKAEAVKADFIEIRLDRFEETRKLSDFSGATKIPLIATNKLPTEGGTFSGTQAQRWQTLINAAKSGFQYVDLDLTSLKLKEQIVDLQELGVKTIVSFHKYDEAFTTQEMQRILSEEISTGASVCKIIGTANRSKIT